MWCRAIGSRGRNRSAPSNSRTNTFRRFMTRPGSFAGSACSSAGPVCAARLGHRRRAFFRAPLQHHQVGRAWLKDVSQRPIADPGRLTQALQGLADRFGGGYAQRATEAVRTYRTGNYLAACVMSGAAAVFILLALAIAKIGDEAKVLMEYNTTGGRRRITKRICLGSCPATRHAARCHVVSLWGIGMTAPATPP